MKRRLKDKKHNNDLRTDFIDELIAYRLSLVKLANIF